MRYFAWPASDFPAVAEWLCSGDDDLPDWLKKFLYVNEQGWDSFHYRQALYPLIQYGLLQLVWKENGQGSRCMAWYSGERRSIIVIRRGINGI
jgi:hypothetical protein